MQSEKSSAVMSLFQFIEDGVHISIGERDGFPFVATATELPLVIVRLVRLRDESLSQLVVRLSDAIAQARETGTPIYDKTEDCARFIQNRYSEGQFWNAWGMHIARFKVAYEAHFYKKVKGYDLPVESAIEIFFCQLPDQADPSHLDMSDYYKSACKSPTEQLRSIVHVAIAAAGNAYRLASDKKFDQGMVALRSAAKHLEEAIQCANSESPFDEDYVTAKKRLGGLARAEKLYKPLKEKAINLLDEKRPDGGWKNKTSAIADIEEDITAFIGNRKTSVATERVFDLVMEWSRDDANVKAAFARNVIPKKVKKSD